MNKDLLVRFFEGKASFQEEKHIREWMEASAENYQIFLRERKMFDAMILLVDEKSINRSSRVRSIFNRRMVRKLLEMAAVIVLTIGITIFFQQHIYKEKLLAMQHIKVPAGQRINLELSDGTIVWLNSRTEIDYPAVFVGDERVVKLDGEAFFEVAKDLEKPFIVETLQGKVEVLGTKFNLEAYSEDSTFVTALMEGSVKVQSNQMHCVLHPNQLAYLAGGKLHVDLIEDFSIYKWREGLICFKDESFSNIMRKFEKYYGVDIVVENPVALDYRYTGKFRHSDGIVYALRVLQKDVNFRFNRDEVNHIIYIK